MVADEVVSAGVRVWVRDSSFLDLIGIFFLSRESGARC